jgi:hypothetical protein
MKPLILIACFLPLALIWLIMKLSIWISAITEEQKYVREESKRPHGPYLENAYADLDEEKEND